MTDPIVSLTAISSKPFGIIAKLRYQLHFYFLSKQECPKIVLHRKSWSYGSSFFIGKPAPGQYKSWLAWRIAVITESSYSLSPMASAHSLGFMPFFATLFALCVTTLAGSLSPSPFIVPVQKLVNTSTTGHSLVRAGQARLQAFSKAHSQVNGIPGDHAALAPPAASLTDQIVTFTINPVVNGKNCEQRRVVNHSFLDSSIV